MRLSTLMHKVSGMQEDFNKRTAEKNILVAQKKELSSRIENVKRDRMHLEQVSALLVKTAESSREAGRTRMEKVVTRALQSIFGHEFEFGILMEESGGKPAAKFVVRSVGENGDIIENEPQDSRGGGINDIVSIALQVATMVVYNNPKIQGPILLDEPGKHVSEEYVVKLGEFLAFISKTFNRQIIMVTHQPHLAMTADKTFVTQIVGGKTVVKETAHDDDEFDWDESDEEESEEVAHA